MQPIQIDKDLGTIPMAKSVEPQLAVSDIVATVTYWHEVLGFPGKWFWGDPPVHAGVNWGEMQIQFTLNPALAAKSDGQQIAINVTGIEALYSSHQSKGAKIVEPLETHPWGLSEYTVLDINGYRLRFGEPASNHKPSVSSLSHHVRLAARLPSPEEYNRLRQAVGWSVMEDPQLVALALKAPVYSVVAEDTQNGEAIGIALLLGDGASFYYVKDVMVHPDWQGQQVGATMLHALVKWAKQNAPEGSYVTLFTGERLKGFYARFGFSPLYGMGLTVRRELP